MIGSVVSHYRVVDRLGAGGMGVVYRAEDLRLGRHVAMKFLPESATADPLATERFQREARTTSALNHPNICTLHDVGEHEGRRFIVMELIDGATLDKVLGAGALPVDRVIDIVDQRRRRPRRRAQRGHPPPRHQAGQHLHHQARPGEGGGLRPGEDDAAPQRPDAGGRHASPSSTP